MFRVIYTDRLNICRQNKAYFAIFRCFWTKNCETADGSNKTETISSVEARIPRDILTGTPLIEKANVRRFSKNHGFTSHLWIRASELHIFTKDRHFEQYRVKSMSTEGYLEGENAQLHAEYHGLPGDEKQTFITKNRSRIFFNLSQIDKPDKLKQYISDKAPIFADSDWPPRFSLQYAMIKHAKRFQLVSRYWISAVNLARIYGNAVTIKPEGRGLKCYYDQTKSLTMKKGPKEVTLYTLDQTSDPKMLERRAERGPMVDLSSGRRIRFECQNTLHSALEANNYASTIWFPSSHTRKLAKLRVNLKNNESGTLIMLGENNPVEYFNADQTDDPNRICDIFRMVKIKFQRFLDVETGEALSRILHVMCTNAQKRHQFGSRYWLSSVQLSKLGGTLRDGVKRAFVVKLRRRKVAYYNVAQLANAKEILRRSAKMRFQKS